MPKAISDSIFNPKYAIEITKLAKVIVPWAFTNNHRLTFGLTSNSLQAPTAQALSLILVILLHNLGLAMKNISTAIDIFNAPFGEFFT